MDLEFSLNASASYVSLSATAFSQESCAFQHLVRNPHHRILNCKQSIKYRISMLVLVSCHDGIAALSIVATALIVK